MINTLNIFNYTSFNEFVENGFDVEKAKSHYSINPYSKTHFEEDINENNNYSYAYVVSNTLDYSDYAKKEKKFINAFETIFEKYHIVGLQFLYDKYVLTEYVGFLSFKSDLLESLREKKSIDFVIDDLGLIINCNYDLVLSIAFFKDESLVTTKDFLKNFEKANLYVTKLE